jgi:hypothetical protein
MQERWDEIRNSASKKIRQRINDTTYERDHHPQYKEESYYYGNGEYRTRNGMMTDEQNKASKECKSGGMKFEIQRRKKSDK